MSDANPSYDSQWKEKYQEVIATPEEAIAKIHPGQRIFLGTGCAQPAELTTALTKRAYELPDTEIVQLLTYGEAPYAAKELSSFFRVNSFFISANVRDIIQEGMGDYTPIFLSDIPRLFKSGRLPLDVALIQVTPPDEHGMCSLGVSVDIVKSAAENSSLVIAEINPNMPRTRGASMLHVYDMDILVPVDTPIIEVPPLETNETVDQIAGNVSALIEDGSTIEVGIGKIPQALLQYLKDKKDLGIHTEMITDGIIDLIECGAVNGSRKTLDRGKVVTSFCLGSRRLYDYIDNNPTFAFHPSEYVNDPSVIRQQRKMAAINTALEVDLTGQVCADSIGTKFYSGVGGQVDFNRGASKSPGGKAVIAIPSTAKNGSVSRIVAQLTPGSGVVTSRAGVHYIVTEFGVAYLHGKSISERAMALISIAHPDCRARLMHEAIEMKYISADLADKESMIFIGPKELRSTYLLKDGTQIQFRPIHPTDMSRMREHFYGLSEQSNFYRFMKSVKRVPQQQIEDFVYIDHRNDVCIVGVLPEASGDKIIAIGSYYLDPTTNHAEVAFTVHDNWQRRGIGTFLFKTLMRIAQRNGLAGFTAEVLPQNKPMISVFNKSESTIHSKREGNVYTFQLDFE